MLILLAGHGVQIPDSLPSREDDIEPDGLDEAFVPAEGSVLVSADRDVDLYLRRERPAAKAFPIPEGVIEAALEALERRLRKRISKL